MILGIDPAGNFDEGKGVTGWSLLDIPSRKFIKFGAIDASTASSMQEHFDRHIDLILNLHKQYPDLVVVMEDFMLYANQAVSQINSRFETVKLIGLIQYTCGKNNIPCTLQTASSVKRRWKDFILHEKGFIVSVPKTKRAYDGTSVEYAINSINGYRVNGHIIDSVRHVAHYLTFKVEKEKQE